jgi:hypothetical protein
MNTTGLRWIAALTALAFAGLLACDANADDWKLLELDEASVNYKSFHPNNHAPLFDGPQKERVTLNLDADVAKFFFFNNKVHGTTTSAQYHLIGWNFQIGARVSKYVDVQYEHHSQHLLDRPAPGHFPVEDSIGFTLIFFRRDNGKASLF